MKAITQDLINEMVRKVVEEFDPIKVILFGSCARGEVNKNSDVDLLVVMPEGTDLRGSAVEIRRALAGSGAPKDIFVATPKQLDRLGNIVGYVYRSALREGKVLYARS